MKIKNVTRTVQTFNLPHESFCASEECACSTATMPLREELPGGGTGVREVSRRLCSSITFLAGEVREVEDRIKRVPEVKGALDRRDLREVES